MSANDIRELENLDRIPEEEGGDLYLINGNMTKLNSFRWGPRKVVTFWGEDELRNEGDFALVRKRVI